MVIHTIPYKIKKNDIHTLNIYNLWGFQISYKQLYLHTVYPEDGYMCDNNIGLLSYM